MEYRDFLDMIVKGIPDTIKVYYKNRIIQFCNKNEINCKEICEHDEIIEAIEIKEMVETQKYIPSINKFMEISYNPILNDLGEVIFIIERQRDITDKITLANTQKKN